MSTAMNNTLKYINTILLTVITAGSAYLTATMNSLENKVEEVYHNQGIIINSSEYAEEDIEETKDRVTALEKRNEEHGFTLKDYNRETESFKAWIDRRYVHK
jgi:uncharacterized protein (DUF2164 family)